MAKIKSPGSTTWTTQIPLGWNPRVSERQVVSFLAGRIPSHQLQVPGDGWKGIQTQKHREYNNPSSRLPPSAAYLQERGAYYLNPAAYLQEQGAYYLSPASPEPRLWLPAACPMWLHLAR